MKVKLELCPQCNKLRIMAELPDPDPRINRKVYYCDHCNITFVTTERTILEKAMNQIG